MAGMESSNQTWVWQKEQCTRDYVPAKKCNFTIAYRQAWLHILRSVNCRNRGSSSASNSVQRSQNYQQKLPRRPSQLALASNLHHQSTIIESSKRTLIEISTNQRTDNCIEMHSKKITLHIRKKTELAIKESRAILITSIHKPLRKTRTTKRAMYLKPPIPRGPASTISSN